MSKKSRKRRLLRRLAGAARSTVAAGAVLLSTWTPQVEATSTDGVNLVLNGSFESFSVHVDKGNWVKAYPDHWVGLDTGSVGRGVDVGSIDPNINFPDTPAEIWRESAAGHPATDGTHRLMLDRGRKIDAIRQDIQTDASTRYELSFDAYARRTGSSDIEVWIDHTYIQTITPTDNWRRYSLQFAGTGELQNIMLREDPAQSNGVGAMLDDVWVTEASGEEATPDLIVGTAEIDDQGAWVEFEHTFQSPVVIAGIPNNSDPDQVLARVTGVSSEGFGFFLQEWAYQDGTHAPEKVDWLALEEGTYQFADGVELEAGLTDIEEPDRWREVVFAAPFSSPPALLLTIQGTQAAQPLTIRARNVTTDGFEVMFQHEEALINQPGDPETLGFLAVDAPSAETSVGNISLAIERAKIDERPVEVLGHTLWVEEEKSVTNETNHTKESANVLVFTDNQPFAGERLFAQEVSGKGFDPIAMRRHLENLDVTLGRLWVTATGTDYVELAWDPASGGEADMVADYRLLRDGAEVVSTSGLIHTDSGLQGATTYVYQVQAIGHSGTVLASSGEVSVQTEEGETAPDTPSELSAVAITWSSVTLGWQAPADGAELYRLYRDGAMVAETNGTTVTDGGLAATTTYQYAVSALANGMESALSAPIQVTTNAPIAQPPAAPRFLLAHSVGPDSAELRWSAPEDTSRMAGYRVLRDGMEITETTETYFIDQGLDELATYSYTVVTFDAQDNVSAPSNSITITTVDVAPPSDPWPVTANVTADGEVHLSWFAADDNVSVAGYRVERNGETIATTTETGLVDVSAPVGLDLDYRVIAFDAAGSESASERTVRVEAGNPEVTGATLAETCFGCHGTDGQSLGGPIPPLAGMDAGYFEGVMADFADGTRHSTMMGRVAQAYTSDEIARMADYFSAHSYTPANQPYNLDLAAQGESVHVARCIQCHGTGGTNLSRGVLAGQWMDYLSATIEDFVDGRSGGVPNSMTTALRALSGAERETLIHYYAGQGSGYQLPPAPTDVTASDVTEYSVTLTWIDVTVDTWTISHYEVWRDGQLIDTSEFSVFTDSGLEAGELYGYQVVAVDAIGNRSQPSTTVVARTNGAPVVVIPSVDRGRDLWNAQGCASCHISAQDFSAAGDVDILINAISDNRGGMGVFSHLSTQDLYDIASYVAEAQNAGNTESGSDIQGISLLDNAATLRKAAILLAGRLPTEEEVAGAQNKNGLRSALIGLMEGERFADFVTHTAKLAFLPGGAVLDNNPLREDWPRLEALRNSNRGEFNRTVNDIRLEPIALTRYIVENDRPYSEILTADYAMVTPRSAYVYGATPMVPFSGQDDGEYRPATLPSISERNAGVEAKPYPHAGVLTTASWLSRFPTTDTNRNRHRAKMLFQQFMGFDIEALGQRPIDDSANGDYHVPTMENPACALCHIPMEPVAGAFQNWGDRYQYSQKGLDSLASDYKSSDYQKDHVGESWYAVGDRWYRDMFPPGFEGKSMPGAHHGFDQAPANGIIAPATPKHVVERAIWYGINGSRVSDLESDSRYPGQPDLVTYLDSLQAPSSFSNSYGQRLRALIVPPTTGSYTFWVASDDKSSLRLSSNSEESAAVEIAQVPRWTKPEQWDKYPEQQSAEIELTGGTAYYVEVAHKEGGGGDHVAVAWSGPGLDQQIVTADYLLKAPASVNNVPGTVPFAENHNGGADSLQWLAREVVQDSRFAKGAALFWYRGLFGRPALSAPMDPTAPGYDDALTAYQTQDGVIEGVAERFAASGLRVKHLLAELIMSDLFRADAIVNGSITGEQRVQLAEVGMSRLLGPDEIDAKGLATVGKSFFDNSTTGLGLLYGGFDGGFDALEPNVDLTPTLTSVVESRIHRQLCDGRMVYDDLNLSPENRVLLPYVTDSTAPYPVEIGQPASAEHVVALSVWQNISGRELSVFDQLNLEVPDTVSWLNALDAPANVGDSYAQRMRALVIPPVSGGYKFWVAANDRASLRLSDSTDPAGLVEIAQAPGPTGRYQWKKYPEQQSEKVYLEAGKAYLIEVIGKEHKGGDHLSVAWKVPGADGQTLITAEHLAAADLVIDQDGPIRFIKQNIAYLHQRLLGEHLALDDPEIERTFGLFKEVYENDVPEDSGLEVYCEARNGADPSRRAWNAVLAYLMSDFDYLHE